MMEGKKNKTGIGVVMLVMCLVVAIVLGEFIMPIVVPVFSKLMGFEMIYLPGQMFFILLPLGIFFLIANHITQGDNDEKI